MILYVFLIEIFSRSMQAHNAVNDELYLPFTQDCHNPVFKYCYPHVDMSGLKDRVIIADN